MQDHSDPAPGGRVTHEISLLKLTTNIAIKTNVQQALLRETKRNKEKIAKSNKKANNMRYFKASRSENPSKISL